MIKGSLVYGFGINDADYPVNITKGFSVYRKTIWRCPYYQKWVNMLDRAYGERKPTYEDVTVCQEWSSFMSFRAWMQTQDWEGKELDKDLKGDGKTYSPETCMFVSKKVNMFLQLKSPNLYKGYWQISARFPDGTRHKFRRLCRESAFQEYISSKKTALSMMSDEDCPPDVKALVEAKLQLFYEEGL